MAQEHERETLVEVGASRVHLFAAEPDPSGAIPIRAHTGDVADWRHVGSVQRSGTDVFTKDMEGLRGMYRRVGGTRDQWDAFLTGVERAVSKLLAR
jgi:hypothetical protein